MKEETRNIVENIEEKMKEEEPPDDLEKEEIKKIQQKKNWEKWWEGTIRLRQTSANPQTIQKTQNRKKEDLLRKRRKNGFGSIEKNKKKETKKKKNVLGTGKNKDGWNQVSVKDLIKNIEEKTQTRTTSGGGNPEK